MRNAVAQAAAQGRWATVTQAQVLQQVVGQLRLQAAVMAYRDALLLITGFVAAAFVLALFIGNPRGGGGGAIAE